MCDTEIPRPVTRWSLLHVPLHRTLNHKRSGFIVAAERHMPVEKAEALARAATSLHLEFASNALWSEHVTAEPDTRLRIWQRAELPRSRAEMELLALACMVQRPN